MLRTLLGRRENTNPLKDLHARNISAGIVSSLLVLTGPPVIMLQAAANGNFTMSQTILWMFAVYVVGGLYSILMPLYYRIPIVGAHTITGVAFLATVTAQFTYEELIGAYLFSGLLMFLIGYFGFFSKLISYVPKEILAAMLAGMILKYMVQFVVAIEQMALVGVMSLLAYFLCSKWLKQVPPIISAIITGFTVLILTESLYVNEIGYGFVVPSILIPEFNIVTFLSVSIPLALLILSNDAAVGISALEQNKYSPPINRIITTSGIFSMFSSLVGGQSANIAGMMTAICADKDAGPKEKRYMGAVVSGVIIILFGIFSFALVPFISSLPQAFLSILIGFALLGVFANSLYVSFSTSTMKLGAACSFIIAASNITVLHISAPVWALLVGTIIARVIEDNHFHKTKQQLNNSA